MAKGRMAKRNAKKRARAEKARREAVVAAAAVATVADPAEVAAQAKAQVVAALRATTPMPWFLLRAYGNERDVEDGLRERGFDAYVPRETMKGVRQGRPLKVVRPLFYGYVFVAIDLNVGQRFDQATALDSGVVGFVKLCGTDQPWMLRPWYVERLRLMEEFGLFDRTTQPLKGGDLVEVIGGEYRGHFAQVMRAKPGDKRVRVLLDQMAGSDTTLVNVQVDDLKLVDAVPLQPIEVAA